MGPFAKGVSTLSCSMALSHQVHSQYQRPVNSLCRPSLHATASESFEVTAPCGKIDLAIILRAGSPRLAHEDLSHAPLKPPDRETLLARTHLRTSLAPSITEHFSAQPICFRNLTAQFFCSSVGVFVYSCPSLRGMIACGNSTTSVGFSRICYRTLNYRAPLTQNDPNLDTALLDPKGYTPIEVPTWPL